MTIDFISFGVLKNEKQKKIKPKSKIIRYLFGE